MLHFPNGARSSWVVFCAFRMHAALIIILAPNFVLGTCGDDTLVFSSSTRRCQQKVWTFSFCFSCFKRRGRRREDTTQHQKPNSQLACRTLLECDLVLLLRGRRAVTCSMCVCVRFARWNCVFAHNASGRKQTFKYTHQTGALINKSQRTKHVMTTELSGKLIRGN
jgi:hypothetical protein